MLTNLDITGLIVNIDGLASQTVLNIASESDGCSSFELTYTDYINSYAYYAIGK